MIGYCIDISGSERESKLALNVVYDDWNTGDIAIVFNSVTAERLSFNDLILYGYGKPLDNIYMDLFKKGSFTKWGTSGIKQAAEHQSIMYCKKICISCKPMPFSELQKFDKVVNINHVLSNDYIKNKFNR